MYVLAIDTSTESGSVALLKDSQVILETNINSGLNHSQTILPAVSDTLKAAGLGTAEIDLFAVTTGPGSFTGLRIGTSIIKGLALAASKPVVSVSTLDAVARNLFAAALPICPFMDAKRGQVYAGLYKCRTDGLPERIIPETLADPRQFLERIQNRVILTGNGINPYQTIIQEVLSGRYLLAPSNMHFIRASSVGLIAVEKFKKGELTDVMVLTPGYLRSSEVQVGGKQHEKA